MDKEEFIEWTKVLFKGTQRAEPRWFNVSKDLLVAMRATYGDEYTYNFVTGTHIMCGADAMDYIIEFKKQYEATKNELPPVEA